jgi:hypothetical protein
VHISTPLKSACHQSVTNVEILQIAQALSSAISLTIVFSVSLIPTVRLQPLNVPTISASLATIPPASIVKLTTAPVSQFVPAAVPVLSVQTVSPIVT